MRHLGKLICTAAGLILLGLMLRSAYEWWSRPELQPWRIQSDRKHHDVGHREGFLYHVSVAPEFNPATMRDAQGAVRPLPITLAIDNNTYVRRALPAAVLHWTFRAKDENQSLLTQTTGTIDTGPDGTLAPGARWMRFVPLDLTHAELPAGTWQIEVELGWGYAEPVTLQILTKAAASRDAPAK